MKATYPILACALLPLLLVLATPLAAEESTAEANQAQRCIQSTRIKRTEVIDDRTVVFHMRGKAIYLNKLPNRCPGMRSTRTVAYRTQTSQLCSVDTITLVETGGGPRRGPTCGLGAFTPITQEALSTLKQSGKSGSEKDSDAEEEPAPD